MTPSDSLLYRAEILDPSRAEDQVRLGALRVEAGIEWIDTFSRQAKELDVLRRGAPAAVSTPDGNRSQGVFVYYPWARRVVRLLAEADFIELRTSRNQHKITAQEQVQLGTQAIGVVGLSVGQSIAFTLALERACGELRLADFDTIDLSNLNRLRCGLHHLGVNKAIVAAREIAELDPYLKVSCFTRGYCSEDAESFLAGLDLVVEECDSLDVKVDVRMAARSRGIPVLMNTSDRGMTDIERFDLEPSRPLFHGLVALPEPAVMKTLDTAGKIPLVMQILGIENTSARLRASMIEIGSSIGTWPQLGADVVLGGAVVCDVARRLLLGGDVPSGRFYVDLAAMGASGSNVSLDARDVSNPSATQVVQPDEIDRIVDDARLAPSAGNVQPWRWTREGNDLVLHGRATEHASVLYDQGLANLVGLGCALETACISAVRRGHEVTTTVDPDAGIRVMPQQRSAAPAVNDDGLFEQIARRRSDRSRPAVAVPLSRWQLDAIAAEVAGFSRIRLSVVQDRTVIEQLAGVLAAGERLRMLDEACHRDLLAEVCWTRQEHDLRREGICVDALGLSAAEQTVMSLLKDPQVVALLREGEMGGHLGGLVGQLVNSSSALGLLWCAGSDREDYLSGGRALQRLWLRATSLGVGLCPITSLGYLFNAMRNHAAISSAMQEALPGLEQQFAGLFGVPHDRGDIVLFRLVPADPQDADVPATLRRPLAQVLTRGMTQSVC